MPILISIIIVTVVVLIFARIYAVFEDKIKFFTKGSDYGFKLGHMSKIWKLAKECSIKEPLTLYTSEAAVTKIITKYLSDAKSRGTENTRTVQEFLEKLYSFKTKVTLDSDDKKGFKNTKQIEEGQKVSIILKNRGVFNSKVLSNGRDLIVTKPFQKNKKTGAPVFLDDDDWINSKISVYFWRKGDASYAFDTVAFNSGVYHGENCLYLRHSKKIDRTQKRQSIRAKCDIYGQMFIVKAENGKKSYSEGFKCLIEDISEDGAMIRIGGKGANNVQIKLQFEINGSVIIMYGIVRAVEYNGKLNQSRIHFECREIDPMMKNTVLSYVYNIIPKEQKDIFDAIKQSSVEYADSDAASID